MRALKKVDIFSFIPVPKDDSVSTKQSLIGTAMFFAIFLTYIIYDFVQFVQTNPPSIQSYRTQMDTNRYLLPRFAYAYMTGGLNDQTDYFNDLFFLNLTKQVKTQGVDNGSYVQYDFVTYDKTNQVANNFQLMPWMSDATKQFYYILRTPTEDLYASGLLYSSDITEYVQLKLYFCSTATNATAACADANSTAVLASYGRVFLFIENQPDRSSISLEKPSANGNNYLLYNFFVVQGLYKRVTINFQVIKDEILPDYFWRWSTEYQTRVQVESILEYVSNTTFNNSRLDAIAFNMQLAPQIINNRVSFTTLIDHISLWGAFWGVLFAVFALFFLSYNRRKFYQKNPAWSKFKKMGSGITINEED